MLSEEALILIAVVGGCALLVLGILEILWPSKPRHPVRRAPPAKAPAARPATTLPAKAPTVKPPTTQPAMAPTAKPAAALPAPPPTATPAGPAATPLRKRRSTVSPHARPHAGGVDRVAEREPAPAHVPSLPIRHQAPVAGGPPPTLPAGSPPAPEVPPFEAPPARSPEPEPARARAATPRIDPLLVERCFSLYQDRHYDEVVSIGEEALAGLGDTPLSTPEAREAAALWSVLALAKQALADDVGASVALESALGVAPPDERATYRQHIAALSLSAAQSALARASSHDTDDRIAELRGALAWSERGLGASPSDERLAETRGIARAELWPAYEQAVHKLLQRQEFREARRLLREALEDPEIPAARVAPFEELLSGTFGGEVGQLTAQAIRSMQEARESEALASLRRAEDLLGTIPDEALPPKRREEVDQRLWWGYTRLGIRRVDAGDYEDALDPLVHALKLSAVGPDRQAEPRAALVRALEGVADRRALAIRGLNDAGDRDEAVLRTETLRELLRSCVELGLSAEDLSGAFAKTRRLCEELGLEDRA